jgi:hypothetical protein
MRHLVFALFATTCGLTVSLHAQHSVQRLQDVRSIYVAPLGGQNNTLTNLISAKLISYLAKHRGISVVEDQDSADAILTGNGQTQSATDASGHVTYRVQAAMRLDNKDGRVLWADDVSSSIFARSATSSFAENVAKKLLEAMFPESASK